MERTCEIQAVRRKFRGLLQDWEFRAVAPDDVVVAASPVFASSLLIPNNGRRERRVLERLLADLTAAGWVAAPVALNRRGEDWWTMHLALPPSR